MDKAEQRIVKESETIFKFLETEFDFFREEPKEEIKRNKGKRVTSLYSKKDIFVMLIIESSSIAVALGKFEKEKPSQPPTAWDPETYAKAFSLDDLIEFRTQGEKLFVSNEKISDENVNSILSEQAKALKLYASDILNGDISVLEELSVINKNKASRFLP